MKVAQSRLTLCDPMDYIVHGILLQAKILHWVAFPFSLGVFPTQGSNPGLLHGRQILFQLSHKGSPRILEWVAYPFSSRASQPRDRTRVSCITGGFFTNWTIREVRPIRTSFFCSRPLEDGAPSPEVPFPWFSAWPRLLIPQDSAALLLPQESFPWSGCS